MTGCKHWLKAAQQLNIDAIGAPVMWLGDDVHYQSAVKSFGSDSVMKMLDNVHYPVTSDLENTYKINDSKFLGSEDYLRAKDRCLKMMDRLDNYGMFSRLDREVFFNQLCISYISKIEKFKPTHLIMTEAPHSHAQYLLFEIAQFFNLEIAWFNTWMIGPIMHLQDMKTMKLIETSKEYKEKVFPKYLNSIDKYINDIESKINGNFEYDYMVNQRRDIMFVTRFKNFFKEDLLRILKDYYHTIKMKFNKKYNHINPYILSPITKEKIRKNRRLNLYRSSKNLSSNNVSLDKKFVYFALHYEPERTTNPDGGVFHDQFIAIQKLRKFVPSNIEIIVKEHPTQFMQIERGPKGRSPLFYNLIKSIKGVTLISSSYDSMELQKKSEFVATITGSIAIESAIMGKQALIFGNAWFMGCPNIALWGNFNNYDDFITSKISSKKEIQDFFNNKFKDHCIIANQNISAQKRNKHLESDNFEDLQVSGAIDLMSRFLIS